MVNADSSPDSSWERVCSEASRRRSRRRLVAFITGAIAIVVSTIGLSNDGLSGAGRGGEIYENRSMAGVENPEMSIQENTGSTNEVGADVEVAAGNEASKNKEDETDGFLCGVNKSTRDLPRCYSSPDARPSKGKWLKCKRGIQDSPVVKINRSQQYSFLTRCDQVWQNSDNSSEPRPYWEWEPEDCSLEAIQSEKFCRVMKGRKGLLLVGDSLTRLFTTTLASILGAQSIKADNMGDKWSACDGELSLRFIRNDYIDVRTQEGFKTNLCEHPNGQPAHNTRCSVFADDKTLGHFDTLVVNSGAHPRTGDEYEAQMLKSSKFLATQMERLHGKDEMVMVFRNTVPGHWGCDERRFEGPVDPSVAKTLVEGAPQTYKWSTFSLNNNRVESGFVADGWEILDAYTPTILRPDSHIGGQDCLHYCLPGPADNWAAMLYSILAARAENLAALGIGL